MNSTRNRFARILLAALTTMLLPQAAWADYDNPENEFDWIVSDGEKLSPARPYVEFNMMYTDEYGYWDTMHNGHIYVKIGDDEVCIFDMHSHSSDKSRLAYSFHSKVDYGVIDVVGDNWKKGSYHRMQTLRYYPGRLVATANSTAQLIIRFDWYTDDNSSKSHSKTITNNIPPSELTSAQGDAANVTFTRQPNHTVDWYVPALSSVEAGSGAYRYVVFKRNAVNTYDFYGSFTTLGDKVYMRETAPEQSGKVKDFYRIVRSSGSESNQGVKDTEPLTLYYYTMATTSTHGSYSCYVGQIHSVKLPGFYYPDNLKVVTQDQWERKVRLTWNKRQKF